jgi:uncharacterized damage-inducible protein DinB
MNPSTLQSLFAHKAWANAELFRELVGLSVELYPMELHNALRTLNHVYVVDRIFCAHLLAHPHGYAASNTAATPHLSDLRLAVAATDTWYQNYVAQATPLQLAEEVFFTFTDGDAGRMTRDEILLHVITHGSYHRGSVGQLLKGISVSPPRDVLTRFLHLPQAQPCGDQWLDD